MKCQEIKHQDTNDSIEMLTLQRCHPLMMRHFVDAQMHWSKNTYSIFMLNVVALVDQQMSLIDFFFAREQVLLRLRHGQKIDFKQWNLNFSCN